MEEFEAQFSTENGFEFEDECKISQGNSGSLSAGYGNGNPTPQDCIKIELDFRLYLIQN